MSRRKGDDRVWVKSRMNPNARIKDLTIPEPELKKKIMYWDSVYNHEQFKAKLKYDNLKQSEFFRVMTQAYVDDDPDILSFVTKYKERMEIHNKPKRKKSKRLAKKAEDVKKDFGLGEEDIEDIFDIIAKEHPDL